jgi:hypothetical protein
MDNQQILQELEQLAARLNITVRYEEGDFNGGLCRIKSDQVIIINKKFPVEKRIAVLSRELSTLNLNVIYILPQLRELIFGELENKP